MGFVTFDQDNDIVTEGEVKLTSGIWSEGAGSLTSFFTSSVQSSSNGQYFLQVYNKVVSDTTSAPQFAIMYGHKGGSGSLGKPGVVGRRESATVYGQMLNLTQPPETELFTFGNGTTNIGQHIYAISFDRARSREKVDPGNWELQLAGGAINSSGEKRIKLIDDSSTNTDHYNGAGISEFNIVSGSIQGGSTTINTAAASEGASSGSFGKFYPDLGLIILNATRLTKTDLGSKDAGPGRSPLFEFSRGPELAGTGNTTYTGSNVLYSPTSHSLHKMYHAISSGSLFQARREEEVTSTHYFCRAVNSKFNKSNNPTYSVTENGESKPLAVFRDGKEKTYITTVGLYDDSNDLLAVAKLSQPILKSKSREALIKVKLDF
mgnify:FL=1|tara:strand:+ start:566 stop:1696 length:1131 start_codon:yes stop_codon:yes gene_type:complete